MVKAGGIEDVIFSPERPRDLYHYSSCSGILAIVSSRQLWASDIDSLNDAKEQLHAVDVMAHSIENFLFRAGRQGGDVSGRVARKLFDSGMGRKALGNCVCSFSEQGDLLSQWRAYGADGRGISIGFNSNLLERDFIAAGFRLGKVIYSYDLQYKLCNSFINEAFPGFDWSIEVEEIPDAVLLKIEKFLNYFGAFFKHSAFADEREWRAVSGENHLYSDDWRFRATQRGLASYIEVPLPSVFSRESEAIGQEFQPHFGFTTGPKVRPKPTHNILQAITYQILGKGYGVSLSGAPYID